MKHKIQANFEQRLKQRVKIAFTLGAFSLFLASLIFLFASKKGDYIPEPSITEEFYFAPISDHHYANPANWKPSYPGTLIKGHQRIHIQGEAYLPFYDLEVEGSMNLGLDASLLGPEGKIWIKKGGEVQNHGKILLESMVQEGKLCNNFTGSIDLDDFETRHSSQTFNLSGGHMVVNHSFYNRGNFRNYGDFKAKNQFKNASDFHQSQGGKLTIKGKPYLQKAIRSLP